MNNTNPIATEVNEIMKGKWFGVDFMSPVANLASLAAFIRLAQRSREENPDLTDEEIFRVVYQELKPVMEWVVSQPTATVPKNRIN